ncbi:MAG: regulator of sigma E protease [Parcubacteria group bacterium Gr01-1014_19]|nr:MAG: regulator of sigma E protease [Parcubacteria group bacterium Gr01-1014_19]
MLVGISILILIHEAGHFFAARRFGIAVEEFGFGFPPRLFAKKIGETLYSVNLLPFGGFVRLFGENQWDSTGGDARASFFKQSAWKRSLVIIAGVAMNFFLGWMLMSLIFMVGTPRVVLVAEVLADSPAASVGILAQDQIVGFDQASDFVNAINQSRGKEINFTISRNGQEIQVKAIPRVSGDGALGVAVVDAGIEKLSIPLAFWEGLRASFSIVIGIIVAFANLLWGLVTQGRLLIDFVGPIGIFGVASQAGSMGFVYLIQLLALISLNLAVLNILPFPALDGGRFLFILIEKIKGSPLRPEFERSANAVGFLLLLLLVISVTIRDVIHLF